MMTQMPISGQKEWTLTRHQATSDLSSSQFTEVVDEGALSHPGDPHDTDDDIMRAAKQMVNLKSDDTIFDGRTDRMLK
jgi:hypothetical protein